jgi:hypothetical protein
MFRPSRPFLAIALFFASTVGALAQAPPLASGQLEIRGNRLTLYADAASGATDARQTLNIGERGMVRTCFGGPTVPCGSVVAGDPRIAGLRVEAELSGPELPQPLVLTTVPGGSFLLPGFQQEGDYTLENIRLVSAASGQVIALAEPSLAVLNVRQIVLSSATVRTLSLEELRARGIELTEENFQAFDFAVGFAIQGYTVEIEFPVVYQGNGQAQPLGKPTIKLDDLPASIVRLVAAWKPPMVQPIRLEPSRDLAPTSFVIADVEHEDLTFPLFGAIVIPGTVTFLNQFFEAQLIVANGAPAGSGTELTRVRAMARLPGNQALRLAETKPPVVPGQWVPVIGADGSQSLAPAEKGSAAWVIEGLKPGTHGLILEIEGELERPGREPLPVRSLAQAAVEVVDARFQLTFSHPDVVRELEEYTLFVTVTNQSQAAQNLIKVDIREESMTGARPADPEDPLSRTIETLQPGQAATVEFRLVSQLTGKVIATTYQSDSTNFMGTIQLRTGVGELGIPLSPATLLMPRFTSELEQRDRALVRHNVALLGLAYSLAVAPASLLPPGLAAVSKPDVERRAIDLAEAGERLYLGESYLETLEALLYDQLGNRHPLESFDQLRRQTTKGLRSAEALAAALRGQQQDRGLDAVGLFDHLTTTMSYARPHLAAVLAPVDGTTLPSLEALDQLGGTGLLAGTADREAAARRTLSWGELYSVRAEAGADSPRASLAVIGRIEGDAANTFLVRNDGSATSRSRLVLIAPDGDEGAFRRLDFGVITLAPGQQLAIDAGAAVAGAGQGGFRPYDPATQVPISAAPAESIVQLPPFRVVGARQDFYLDFSVDEAGNWYQPNRYGNGITYLFNRPPEAGLAEVPEAFEIASDFDGQTISDTPFAASSTKVGQAAFIQPNSERVVIVRYDGGISALVDGGMPLVEHRHQLDQGSIRDRFGGALAEPVPAPRIESSPLHVGALVAGQVKRGSGGPVAGVQVELMRQRWFLKPSGNHIIFTDLASTTTTDAAGRFFFDYFESPIHDGKIKPEFFLRAQVPAGADPLTEPAEVGEVSFTMRRQNKAMVVNIALLGRGGITGRLTYLDNGAPVPFGTVEAASTLFSEQQKVTVEADGTFRFLGLPVGPISLAGRDSQGRRVYATVEIPAPGAVAHVDLEIQRQTTVPPQYGTVTGKVLFLRDGVPEPALGATIAIYADGYFLGSKEVGAAGGFTFTQIPAGRVSLQAANFRVSRTAIYTDLMLGVEEVREVELRIPASSPKSVSGQVVQRDLSTGAVVPLAGATVLLVGPGNLTFTGADGRYLLENVPIQSSNNDGYELQVISPDRTRERLVELPPILAASPDETVAETAVFDISSVTRGRVRGRVFDPNGQPVPFAKVVLYPFDAGGEADATGAFVFENVPFGTYFVVGRVDDGLTPGKIGWLGKTEPFSLAGNPADAFVEVHMRGSGFVKVHTRTATSTGILTPIFYKPTYYSNAAKDILLRGSFTESSTDPNGHFEVELPLGDFHIVAYNPFHGQKEISDTLTAAGELKEYEIVFETLGKVRGTVVEPDGITPVPFAEVVLSTRSLLPQTLQADEQGKFLFELVPAGPVSVAGRAMVGNVERVGRTLSDIGIGQDLELTVVLLKQGSIKGRVRQESSPGQLVKVPNAQYYVQESSYPHRRLPEGEGTFYSTDANGEYEVPHLFAGDIQVVARDSGDITRGGKATAKIEVDWSIVVAPDIVFRGADALGKITLLVRDPQTGAPVADALVRLSTGEGSVTGADGTVVFEALKVWMSENRPMTYTARAFYAPTGQAGESGPVVLSQAGEAAVAEIYLDQRGEVRGFLYSDPSRTEPIAGATIKISGFSTAGRVEGLTTTSGQAGQLGRFVFSGIPEGTYTLLAASTETPRRAGTTVALTDTSPIVDLFLYLEQVGDRYFRIDQKLRAGNAPVDLAAGIFSVKLVQGDPSLPDYAFTNLLPEAGSNLFLFQDIFLERGAGVEARELDGELRSFRASTPNFVYTNSLPGGGTIGDPHRLVLPPKGTVTAEVRDADDRPVAGINVRLGAAGTNYASATGADGKVSFVAVNAGTVTVSARSFDNIFSGSATGTIVYDDDALALTIRFQPAVRATGRVYSPPLFDRAVIDPSTLEPLPAARVELVDKNGVRHVGFTDGAGVYVFEGLPKGAYTVSAASPDGSQIASHAGNLLDPNGNLNQIPALVLDGGPPKIVQMSPPSGASGVSKTTTVEIIFSEPLAAGFLPTGPSSQHFFFRKSSGNVAVAGNWIHFPDSEGRQIVRFVPGQPLEDFTLYSLTIRGWVTDRVGRLLNPAGDVGSSFRTSDASGPTVLSTEPLLSRPVHPAASIRIDFNERVVASAEDLDGDGNADAAVLEARKLDGSWVALPSVYYLTRLNFSLQLDLPQGLSVPDDSLRRRLTVSRLRDESGNPMVTWQREFRLYDNNTPTLAVPLPAGAPDGNLYRSLTYKLSPVLGNLDDVTAQLPGGDLDRVEYFFTDPATNSNPPGFVAQVHPFEYSFVAAYVGSGQPRPFPVWVRAVDTSNNATPVVFLDMRVLPNVPPSVGTVAATSSVHGQTFYSGNPVVVTATGIADPDSSQLSLLLELIRADTQVAKQIVSMVATRPTAGVWDLSQLHTFTVSPGNMSLPEGTPFFFRVAAVDGSSARTTADSPAYLIADDATAPTVSLLGIFDAGNSSALQFVQGETIRIRFAASDAETGLKTQRIVFDRTDFFPQPLAVSPRTGGFEGSVRIPAGIVTEPTEVVATIESEDYGGNVTRVPAAFQIRPSDDPFAPVAIWTSPFTASLWPASYTSNLPGAGVPLLLRARVEDKSQDAGGATVPGELYAVEMRGPEIAPDGSVRMTETWTPAVLVSGTGSPGAGDYQLLWHVPNDLPAGTVLSFAVRATDLGAVQTVEVVQMMVVPARRVYQGVTSAIFPTDPMLDFNSPDPNGPVFFLDGTLLSIYPQTDGSLRTLPGGLFLYSGGFMSSGSINRKDSRLVPVEINSLDSAVLYYPLELGIETMLGVGAGSAIDGGGAGLLGGTLSRPIELPGLEGQQTNEAGYHGGMVRLVDSTPEKLSRTYGNARWPLLPGLGGRSNIVSTDFRQGGGPGGGAIRIEAADAVVHLDGAITARGLHLPRGVSFGQLYGGAGGSIALRAGRLEGLGRIDASSSNAARPGGGGRVAVIYGQVGEEFDLEDKVVARGGSDGSGTIYLEQLDADGASSGIGRLRVVNNDTSWLTGVTVLPGIGSGELLAVDPANGRLTLDAARVAGDPQGSRVVLEQSSATLGQLEILGAEPATTAEGTRVALTVAAEPGVLESLAAALASGPVAFSGRQRFASVELAGEVRLLVRDDLALGSAEAPSAQLNDESLVLRDQKARWQLRGQGFSTAIDPSPPESEVFYFTELNVLYELRHPLGIENHSTRWSFQATAQEQAHDQVRQVGGSKGAVLVPHEIASGPVGLSIEARGLDGSLLRRNLEWTLLENEPPTVELSVNLAAVSGGETLEIVVAGSDLEGLASLRLAVDSSWHPAVQNHNFNGHTTSGQHLFTVEVPTDAYGPIVLTASAVDEYGASTSKSLTIETDQGSPPTGSWSISQEPVLEPGGNFDIFVSGEDVDGNLSLARITSSTGPIDLDNSLTTTGLNGSSSGSSLQVLIALGAESGEVITVWGEVVDLQGNTFELPPLSVTVAADTDPPWLNVLAPSEIAIGQSLSLSAQAGDVALDRIEISFDGQTASFPANGERYITAYFASPPLADRPDPVPLPLLIRAFDAHGNVAEYLQYVVVLPDQPPWVYVSFTTDAWDPELEDYVVTPGSSLEIYFGAGDEIQLVSGQATVGGIFSETRSLDQDGNASFSLRVPENAQLGEAIELSVTATDSKGQVTTDSRTLYVTQIGLEPPSMELYLDPEPAGGIYRAGESLSLFATGRAGVDLGQVSIELAGQTATGLGVAAGDWTLPQVGQATTREIKVKVVSPLGVTKVFERSISIRPNRAAEVDLACPSAGALLPVGATFPFALEGRAAAGIRRIELYRGTQLVGALQPQGDPEEYSGSLEVTLPAVAGPVTYRTVLVPAAGNPVERSFQIELVEATRLGPSDPADWESLTGETVALEAGAWTFDQPRSFSNLILLPGAVLRHSERGSDPLDPKLEVALDVAGKLYLACGAAIDVSGRGFANPAETRGGDNVGGGGLAGYGGGGKNAVYWPRQPGGGSGASRGGGVAAIRAGSLVLDGEIRADGQGSGTQDGGGAGGSIWLHLDGSLAGSGEISADGAASVAASAGAGGGGAVAIEAAELPGDLSDRVSVEGGGGAHPGGAGALVLKTAGQLTGHLIVDGSSVKPTGWTQILILGDPTGDFGSLQDNVLLIDDPGYEPEQLRGTIVALEGRGTGGGARPNFLSGEVDGPDYFRVVAARRQVIVCPEEEPYCACEAGGDCPEVPEDGGSDIGSAAQAMQSAPSGAFYTGYFELELEGLAGAELPESQNVRYTSFALFDRISFRGQTKVAAGHSNLSTGLLDIDGTDWGLTSGDVVSSFSASPNLLLRRGARLAGEKGSIDGTAFRVSAARDLILAPGASIDATGASTMDWNFTPEGAAASHLGFGGGLRSSPLYLIYDSYFDPSSPGMMTGGAFGGGSLILTTDIAYLGANTALLANADPGSGSGGSVNVATRVLAGEARLEANGGTSENFHGGGGGGIRVSYQEARGLWRERAFACGGGAPAGFEAGGAGTVLLVGPESNAGDLILDNCGLSGAFTPKIVASSVDSLTVRGGARIDSQLGDLTDYGRLELRGASTYFAGEIAAEELILGDGAVLSADLPSAATSTPTLSLRIDGDLVLDSGARIDVSGQGLATAHPEVATSGGNHIGYRYYTSVGGRGKTYGSVTRPREPGAGSSNTNRGGGYLDIEAANVQLDGADTGLFANGSSATGANAAGGSIWLRTGNLDGDGSIEARGSGNSGGGAIALDYAASSGSVLDHARAWGGANATTSGGAGSLFLFDRGQATYGVLRLDNNDRPGTTELPSLEDGTAAVGTSGADLVTDRTVIPSFFAGHWIEVRTSTGQLKGAWRVGSISGSTLHLEQNGEEAIELEPNDEWVGFYIFDRLERDLLVSIDAIDLIRAPIVDFLGTGVPAGEAAMQTATSSLGPGETVTRPAADPSVIRFEAAEIEGLYRVTVPASIYPAARNFSWMRLGDLGRSVTTTWDPRLGATFLWAGEPGARLRLQAFEPRRPQEPLSLELPPLPEPPASVGFGVAVQAEEQILDLFGGEHSAYLLLGRGEELELLEIDFEGRAIRSLGSLPRLHAEHRLTLQDGELGIAARGGVDGLADAFLVPGASGFEPWPLGLASELFARPAGAHGQFRPTTEIQ